MSLPAKRQHDEGESCGKREHVVSGMVAESACAFGVGVADMRPAKVMRHGDRAGEPERPDILVAGRLGGREGANDAAFGDGAHVGRDGGVATLKIKVRESGVGNADGKSDRMDLERKMSGAKEHGDAMKESGGYSKEVLGRVGDGKSEVQGLGLGQGLGVVGDGVGQELAEHHRGDGNSEGVRKKSPRDGEVKAAVKDVAVDVKRDEVRDKEKEKEKKEEKRAERKEDAAPVLLHQSVVLQAHSVDVHGEKDNEKDEVERDKSEKERLRDRERSRDREKEALRLEKREKREKEPYRDSHRREREEREDGVVEKLEKEDGKGIKIEEPVRGEVDDRKVVEKEGRERVRDREKEKEEEGEGDKRKKRMREEKDRDSLNAVDAEGSGGDKDKDAGHSYGVQQRKRMLRPRGHANPANRESRSRFRPKDTEVTQGRTETASIIYRIGEGMPELEKIRKQLKEAAEKNGVALGPGPTIDIRIPAELATSTNRQIRGSQLWGTDIYTDDSDIVAVLMHTGYFSAPTSPLPNSILELQATIRILDSQTMYWSSLRNNVRSRVWGGGSGCSYRVEKCRILKQGGGTVELEPCLTRNPLIAPTLAPATSERTVTTRAASSSAYRQHRLIQEVTIQYNLCNEPWAKYHISIVADRGLKKSQFTSARLKSGEVLYVETHVHRYELAYEAERTTSNGATTATSSFPQGNSGLEKGKEKWGVAERALVASEKEPTLHTHNGEKSYGNHPSNGQTGGHQSHCASHHNGEQHEHYRWSKCKRPLSLSSMQKKGIPLSAEFVEVLEENLSWEEIQWAPTSVWVRGTEYVLTRAQFYSFNKDDAKE